MPQVDELSEYTSKKSEEQAESVENIKQKISKISEGIAETTAMSEESSATSQGLATQAAALNSLVERFELQ